MIRIKARTVHALVEDCLIPMLSFQEKPNRVVPERGDSEVSFNRMKKRII